MRIALAAVAACLCVASPRADAAKTGDSCRATTEAAFRACKGDTQGEKWTRLGRCENEADAAATKTCRQQVSADTHDAADTCGKQHAARKAVCAKLGRAPFAPAIDPANFVATIDNPLFPLVPGTLFTYEGQTAAGLEHEEFLVTRNTRVILGVTCVEVHDTVLLNGQLTEDTLDWFAQDKAGNVWYFGENSKVVADGLVVDLEGSWTGGIDEAHPGIVMEAHPAVGDFYRQEFLLGVAEDMAEVVSLAEPATVPFGSFPQCLKTKETAPLEPDALENKFYGTGIGNVLTVDLTTNERSELVAITTE